MAHFTVEQVKDLATAYFIGRDTYREYPVDWFNGGEDLFYGIEDEVEIDGQKFLFQNCKIISLENAISFYANNDDDCYYKETMNGDVPDFCIMMGETFQCDEVHYDWDNECNTFLNQDYTKAVIDAWHDIIGTEIIHRIAEEYNYYAKGYNASH